MIYVHQIGLPALAMYLNVVPVERWRIGELWELHSATATDPNGATKPRLGLVRESLIKCIIINSLGAKTIRGFAKIVLEP
jgi:hypothetical protein